jgi:hypothetical protein
MTREEKSTGVKLKTCKACGATEELSEFGRIWNSKYQKYYYDGKCRSCRLTKQYANPNRAHRYTGKGHKYRKTRWDGPVYVLQCSKCKQFKSRDEYHRASCSPHGVRSRCKECLKPYPKKTYKPREDNQTLRKAIRRGFKKQLTSN